MHITVKLTEATTISRHLFRASENSDDGAIYYEATPPRKETAARARGPGFAASFGRLEVQSIRIGSTSYPYWSWRTSGNYWGKRLTQSGENDSHLRTAI